MTYSNASDWADRNIPKDEFDTFEEWLNFATAESDNGLQTPNLLSESDFVNSMRRYWLDEVGAFDRNQVFIDDEIPEPEEPIRDEIPVEPSQHRDIQIDSGFVVTRQGAMPIKVVDVKTDDSPPIIITEQQSTAQRLPEPERRQLGRTIPRTQVRNRLANVATRLRGLASGLRGFLRRNR